MICINCGSEYNGTLCEDCQKYFKNIKKKPCKTCKKVLDWSKFGKKIRSIFNLTSQCKSCRKVNDKLEKVIVKK